MYSDRLPLNAFRIATVPFTFILRTVLRTLTERFKGRHLDRPLELDHDEVGQISAESDMPPNIIIAKSLL